MTIEYSHRKKYKITKCESNPDSFYIYNISSKHYITYREVIGSQSLLLYFSNLKEANEYLVNTNSATTILEIEYCDPELEYYNKQILNYIQS